MNPININIALFLCVFFASSTLTQATYSHNGLFSYFGSISFGAHNDYGRFTLNRVEAVVLPSVEIRRDTYQVLAGVLVTAYVPEKTSSKLNIRVHASDASVCHVRSQIAYQKMNGQFTFISPSKVSFGSDYCLIEIEVKDQGNHDLDRTSGSIRVRLVAVAKNFGSVSSTNRATSSTASSSSTTMSTTSTTTATTTTTSAVSSALSANDIAILNFALNLEYLEAEFYLAAIGRRPSYENQVTGRVTGGRRVSFSSPELEEYAREIAEDEENHVVFLRTVLGAAAVDRPDIDISGGPSGAFGIAAKAAGSNARLGSHTQIALSEFSPYANELFFLHGAFIFEDVGVTAYKGAAPLLDNANILSAAAGILAVEAYHAANVRTLLFARRDVVALRAGAYRNSDALRVRDIVGAISDLRDALGNAGDKDQNIVDRSGRANIVPTDENSVAFSRTPREVLNIVYGGGQSSGLFFPNGVEGDFSALL